MYQIDFYKFLMRFKELHLFLNQQQVVKNFIELLQVHDDPKIVRSLSIALKESSHTTQFYPDLLSDNALNAILTKMLDAPEDSLEPLFECFNSVLNKTKAPIKYLVATSILKLSESDQFTKKIAILPSSTTPATNKSGDNIIYILKVL